MICFILPVKNRKHYTENILNQIHEQIANNPSHEFAIIVVDDGSSDGTPEIIRTRFPSVNLIQGDGTLWWTGAICLGMNYGMKNLAVDYFLWLNDDIFLAQDFIEQVCHVCNSPNFYNTVIGGIVCDKNYPDWIVYSGMYHKRLIRRWDDFASQPIMEVDALNGNITLIPYPVVEKIGLPDAKRFRHYGGDFEFVSRAKESGFKILLSRQIQATTDFQVEDLIRRMPPWMQWHLAQSLGKRLAIIAGLTNLKCHYNIWHEVNINHCHDPSIARWKYYRFYVRKVIKLIVRNFWRKTKIEQEFKEYLNQQNAPPELEDLIFNKLKKNTNPI